jgi:hypothetical protein
MPVQDDTGGGSYNTFYRMCSLKRPMPVQDDTGGGDSVTAIRGTVCQLLIHQIRVLIDRELRCAYLDV